MAESQFKTTLSNIVSSISTNKNILDDLKEDNTMIVELLNTIYQRVEDMSKKFDEVLNAGIKKPKTAAKKESSNDNTNKSSTPSKKNVKTSEKNLDGGSSGKVIKNIMTYFKTRYLEDPSVFNNILEEKQAESIFAEHADEISAKSEGVQRNKIKAAILYKNITKEQKKKIREKMLNENESASVNNDEDIEEESDSN